jgi:hypothetical protein
MDEKSPFVRNMPQSGDHLAEKIGHLVRYDQGMLTDDMRFCSGHG